VTVVVNVRSGLIDGVFAETNSAEEVKITLVMQVLGPQYKRSFSVCRWQYIDIVVVVVMGSQKRLIQPTLYVGFTGQSVQRFITK
jgi:hypothetical protein